MVVSRSQIPVLVAVITLFAHGAEGQLPRAAEKVTKSTTLTGCLDQKDGQYVLAEEQTLKSLAALQAEGFSQEGFAKYLGNKIAVQGSLSSSGDPPVMKVRSVRKVSDLCGSERNQSQ